ncbi:putative glutaredoxin [Escherichia phage A221]|nr:putative glutaredoxin [Escherichia phage A221]
MKGLEHKILKLDKDYRLEELQQLTGKPRVSMPVIVLADQTVTDVNGLAASIKR